MCDSCSELCLKTLYLSEACVSALQFAWGSDADNVHLPHNHYENSVCYPGTQCHASPATLENRQVERNFGFGIHVRTLLR